MLRSPRLAVSAVALLIAQVLPDASADAQRRSLLDEVTAAMGGRDRVLAVRTLDLRGTGENYNLGQNRSPAADLPVFIVTEYRRVIDFQRNRWRQEQVRQPRFVTAMRAAQRQRIGFDSVFSFDVLQDGTLRRNPQRSATDRASELLYHPIGFLQRAYAAGSQVSEDALRGKYRHLQLNAGGNRLSMLVDRRTRLPHQILQYVYHPMLGDVLHVTELSSWRPIDGVMLPMRIVQRLDERSQDTDVALTRVRFWPLADIRLSSSAVNEDVGDLSASAAIRTSDVPAPTVNVVVDTIAPGVWYLAGQSHHSVAIEMRDHLLLVEAPQNEARTLAVIQRARTLRPGKPVRAVINTHHHFDHAGGIRAAMSEGLTVYTHAENKSFFENLARRRHHIVQDALARRSRTVRVEPVTSRRAVSDEFRTIELHHIRGNPHAETLLMVYLPREKLLIEADVYTPPAANAPQGPAPFAANLVQNIERLGLDVERIVPVHGRVVSLADLRNAVEAGAGR